MQTLSEAFAFCLIFALPFGVLILGRLFPKQPVLFRYEYILAWPPLFVGFGWIQLTCRLMSKGLLASASPGFFPLQFVLDALFPGLAIRARQRASSGLVI